MSKRLLHLLVLLASLALVANVAACSDDDETTTTETDGNLVEVATEAGFSTLVTAVQTAELEATLSTGNYTIFAPSNAAFDALEAGALDALLADKDALTDVLTFHVVEGRLESGDVVAAGTLTTLQGGTLEVTVEGDTVMIGGATITTVDVPASNGIIHVIDTVLMPEGETQMDGTIVDVAAAAGTFETLLAAAEAADLVDALNADGPLTLFAPSDEAFAKIPAADLDALLADKDALTQVLLYHVVADTYDATAVLESSLLPTLNGIDLKVDTSGETATIGGSGITATDISADNGVIHVIDTVIMPPGSIADLAVATDDLSTLVTALSEAELVETLQGEGPFTVFAPTNAAFEKIPAADLEALLADKEALTNVLLYHVVPEKLAAADVVAETELTAAQEGTLAVVVEGESVTVGGSAVIATDIPAANGVIHLIDTVILPPAE